MYPGCTLLKGPRARKSFPRSTHFSNVADEVLLNKDETFYNYMSSNRASSRDSKQTLPSAFSQPVASTWSLARRRRRRRQDDTKTQPLAGSQPTTQSNPNPFTGSGATPSREEILRRRAPSPEDDAHLMDEDSVATNDSHDPEVKCYLQQLLPEYRLLFNNFKTLYKKTFLLERGINRLKDEVDNSIINKGLQIACKISLPEEFKGQQAQMYTDVKACNLNLQKEVLNCRIIQHQRLLDEQKVFVSTTCTETILPLLEFCPADIKPDVIKSFMDYITEAIGEFKVKFKVEIARKGLKEKTRKDKLQRQKEKLLNVSDPTVRDIINEAVQESVQKVLTSFGVKDLSLTSAQDRSLSALHSKSGPRRNSAGKPPNNSATGRYSRRNSEKNSQKIPKKYKGNGPQLNREIPQPHGAGRGRRGRARGRGRSRRGRSTARGRSKRNT